MTLEEKAEEYANEKCKDCYMCSYSECKNPYEVCEKRQCRKQAYIAGAEPREKRIEELEQKLEQTEKDLADYQFNYPTIKELEDHLAEEVELHLHAEEYTKSLEQEYNKLLDVINNQDVKIADLDETIANLKEQVQSQVEATIELDKENAELESDFRICEHNADTYYDQLVKATEIIEEFLSYYHSNEYPYQMLEILGKAEQFIKDSEK